MLEKILNKIWLGVLMNLKLIAKFDTVLKGKYTTSIVTHMTWNGPTTISYFYKASCYPISDIESSTKYKFLSSSTFLPLIAMEWIPI